MSLSRFANFTKTAHGIFKNHRIVATAAVDGFPLQQWVLKDAPGMSFYDGVEFIADDPKTVVSAYERVHKHGYVEHDYYIDGTYAMGALKRHGDYIHHTAYAYVIDIPPSVEVVINDRVAHSYVPPGTEHLYVRPEDIVGKHIIDVLPTIDGADKALSAYLMALSTQTHQTYEYSIGGILRHATVIPHGTKKAFHISKVCPPPKSE